MTQQLNVLSLYIRLHEIDPQSLRNSYSHLYEHLYVYFLYAALLLEFVDLIKSALYRAHVYQQTM